MPSLPNPYEVLQIAARSSAAEVVARGQELIATAAGEDEKQSLRSAVEVLATHPRERAYHKFWEPSGSAYGNTAEADFRRRHGKPPVTRREIRQRAAAFVDEECSPLRLLKSLAPELAPPADLVASPPGDAGWSREETSVEPSEIFL